jgi:hypothetical protein
MGAQALRLAEGGEMMIYVTAYLVIGGLTALLLYFVFDRAIKARDEEPEFDVALREVEEPIGQIPGGMVTTLLLMVVVWPMFWGTYIRNQLRRKG